MEKEFKKGDVVFVNGIVKFDSYNGLIHVETLEGDRILCNKENTKHAKPEFVPREMMVWNKDGDIAQKRFISGIFDGWYMYKEEWGGYYSYRNAKEITQELENGKVYKLGDVIVYKTDKRAGFGFDKNGYFNTDISISFNGDWQPYHIEDFKKLLIAEAEKRGFKSGVWVDRQQINIDIPLRRIEYIDNDTYPDDEGIIPQNDESNCFIEVNGFVVFNNGTWAKIID